MSRLEVTVLGAVRIDVDGAPVDLGPRLRRLLACLVANAGVVVSVDRLADVVWEGEPPEGAERTVRTYVTRLRRALDAGADAIEHRAPGYVFTLDEVVDSAAFEAELDDALVCLRAADHADAAQLLDQALARWQGPAYAGFEFESWVRPVAVHLEERRVEAREAQIEVLLAIGDTERAVASARALVEEEPLRERPCVLLMSALYAGGRQADALRQFQAFADRLAEAGLEPTPSVIALEGRIVRGESVGVGGGERLRGYELGARLGEGAFAVVHAGVQPSLSREVAIKVIRGELADRPEFIRRFELEAQTIARLEHPNIVPLYDFWREPGAAFLVMRLMRGGTVEEALRRRGSASADQVVRLLHDVGGALTLAHRSGVVHRDIRPANLLLDAEGTAYVSDFGVALHFEADPSGEVRHPTYSAPEVLRGHEIGPSADIVSLGITVFELLTGRLPFAGVTDRSELVRRQLTEPMPSVSSLRPELPPQVDQVLARATAKSPGDRYESVSAFVEDLTGALTRTGTRVRSSGASASGDVPNPYVGLRAFEEGDHERFVGREALVAELVAAVERHPFVTVIGPSGSGKSSAVRAGLIPALRRGAVAGSERWFISTLTPGADPFDALEISLLRVAVNPPVSLRAQLSEPGGLLRSIRRVLPDERAQLLLVIDQFEELFTQTVDPDLRRRFFDELAAAVDADGAPVRVVTTIRADHLDAPLQDPAIADLVSSATVAVTPMSPEELERSIVRPAAMLGVEVESALAARLVGQVTENPGALPLLQYALTEVFERRVASTMLLETHEELGGLSGALAARADRIVDRDESIEESDVRRVFGRLVALDEGSDDTRRRALRSELGTDAGTTALLDGFVKARLLLVDADEATREPTVEVAHEALLREWPRLKGWIDEDRSDLVALHSSSRSAAEWVSADRDPGELARSGRLEVVRELRARRPEWLTPVETEWVDASVAANRAEQEERDAIAARDRRQNRRLRQLLVAAGVLAALAVAAAAVALVLRGRADEAAEQADIERLVALSASLIESEPDRAILLALEAHRRDPGVMTAGAVQRTIATEPRFVGHLPALGSDGVQAISAEGPTLVVSEAGEDGATELRFLDAIDGGAQAPDVELAFRPQWLAVSGDGSTAAAGTAEGSQLEVVARDETVDLPVDGVPTAAVFDREGDHVAIEYRFAGVTVVDLADSTVVTTYPYDDDERTDERLAAMAPDGGRIALVRFGTVVTIAPSTFVIDGRTGEVIIEHPSRHGEPFRVAFADDGGYAIGYIDGAVEVFDADGTLVRTLIGLSASVWELAFGPDGGIVAATTEGELAQWSATGALVGDVIELGERVAGFGFTADDDIVVVLSDGGRVVVDPQGGAIVDETYPVPIAVSVDVHSPNFDQPGLDENERVTQVILSRLRDGELLRQIDLSAGTPNGSAQPPFYSIDGEWLISFDQREPTAAIAEVNGDRVHVVDRAEVRDRMGLDRSPGATRVSATGDRLIEIGNTPQGRSRVAAFSLPDLRLEAGPLDIGGVFGPILELRNGDIITSGGTSFGDTGRVGLVQIVDGDLGEPAEAIEGTEGMAVFHEGPDGSVVLGSGSGRLAILDPSSRSVRSLADQPFAIRAAAMSPDATTIAAVMPQVGVQLVDVESGRSIGSPMLGAPFGERSAPGVRWADDGRFVWTDPLVGAQRLVADPELWVAKACEIVQRDLTLGEWQAFVDADSEPISVCGRDG